MPITDKSTNHIHDLKKSSDPSRLFVKANESFLKTIVFSNVKVDGNIWVLEMIFFSIIYQYFIILLNCDLFFKNVGWDEVFEINRRINQTFILSIVNNFLLVLFAQKTISVELLL